MGSDLLTAVGSGLLMAVGSDLLTVVGSGLLTAVGSDLLTAVGSSGFFLTEAHWPLSSVYCCLPGVTLGVLLNCSTRRK